MKNRNKLKLRLICALCIAILIGIGMCIAFWVSAFLNRPPYFVSVPHEDVMAYTSVYNLFDSQYRNYLIVGGIIITLFGFCVPLLLYMFQQQSLRYEREQIKESQKDLKIKLDALENSRIELIIKQSELEKEISQYKQDGMAINDEIKKIGAQVKEEINAQETKNLILSKWISSDTSCTFREFARQECTKKTADPYILFYYYIVAIQTHALFDTSSKEFFDLFNEMTNAIGLSVSSPPPRGNYDSKFFNGESIKYIEDILKKNLPLKIKEKLEVWRDQLKNLI